MPRSRAVSRELRLHSDPRLLGVIFISIQLNEIGHDAINVSSNVAQNKDGKQRLDEKNLHIKALKSLESRKINDS